jgi:hypothetical protein
MRLIHTIGLALTLAAPLALSGAGAANAWDKTVTVNTKNGDATKQIDRYCFDGACYRESQITMPDGKVFNRQSMCVKAAPHQWTCKITTTGPDGKHWTKFRTHAAKVN